MSDENENEEELDDYTQLFDNEEELAEGYNALLHEFIIQQLYLTSILDEAGGSIQISETGFEDSFTMTRRSMYTIFGRSTGNDTITISLEIPPAEKDEEIDED